MNHFSFSYAEHTSKIIMSSQHQVGVALLVCIYLREHTKARNQNCLLEPQRFNYLLQALLWQVIFQLYFQYCYQIQMLIQRDFNMAIGWWLETGIYSKMAKDVGQNQNWTTEWTRPTTHEQESLKLSHLLLLFIIFGAAIMFSMGAFGLEVLSQRGKRKKESRTRRKRRRPYAGSVQLFHRRSHCISKIV